MQSKLFALALLAIVFCQFKEVQCFKCTAKSFKCPETAVTIDLKKSAILRPVKRNLIYQIWNSTILPPMTVLAQQYINKIFYFLGTDSDRLLDILYINSFITIQYLSDVQNYPPACRLARMINASIEWVENRNGASAAGAVLNSANTGFQICSMIMYASLRDLGCPDPPQYEPLDARCYKRGFVYDIEKLLAVSGKFLPCVLKQLVLELYASKEYVDNMLAVTFAVSITTFWQDILPVLPQPQLIEIINFIINNKASRCCCEKRLLRLKALCAFQNTTSITNANHLVETIYLAPEC